MRPILVLFLAISTALAFSPRCPAEGGKATSPDSFQATLLSFIKGRLDQAQLNREGLRGQQVVGVATLPQILGAEDEIDRWELHLRLLTDAGLVAEHPVLAELRREFRVPEAPAAVSRSQREAAKKIAEEYLQRKLGRAERLLGSVKTLFEVERATEADKLAAQNAVEAIKLLLAAEQYNLRDAKE